MDAVAELRLGSRSGTRPGASVTGGSSQDNRRLLRSATRAQDPDGFTAGEVAELKAAYRTIYRSGLMWSDVVATLKENHPDGPAAKFHEFLSQGTRGFVQERRMPPTATLKLRRSDEEEVQPAMPAAVVEQGGLKSKAG